MLSSVATLGTVQLARNAAPAVRLPRSPARAAMLEGLRRRNAVLDGLFYDISVVDESEAVAIAPWLAAEGAVLIVPPSGAGKLTLCPSAEDFVAHGGEAVHALAIAGVGSSALGSAAFARNVADAVGRPVAAVVSGYGLADLLTEALGGYFWFGALNGIRHMFEGLDRLAGAASGSGDRTVADAGDHLLRGSRDTKTVLALLSDPRLSFDLLTGHSKGNLVLAEALYELAERNRERARAIANRARIVTVSAVIAMPPVFSDVTDIIGAWDWFGGLNSRRDIDADVIVPKAWHHTNTELTAHLPVTETLANVLT